MSEYRVEVKIKNNLIISRIEKAGYKTIGKFCSKNNISSTEFYKVCSLKLSPLNKSGEWKHVILKTSELLNCSPENFFTEYQLNHILKTNKKTLLVNEAELKYMINQSNDTKLLEDIVFEEQRKIEIQKCLDTLSPREQKVIKMRFGLEGRECTLEECSKEFGVQRERIRQIEAKALRKLKHPDRNKTLREIDEIDEI